MTDMITIRYDIDDIPNSNDLKFMQILDGCL